MAKKGIKKLKLEDILNINDDNKNLILEEEKRYFLNNIEQYLDKIIKNENIPIKNTLKRQKKPNKFLKNQYKNDMPTLDLHHKNSIEALISLQAFINNCLKNDQKKALIIVGKGKHSKEGPILKDFILKELQTIKYNEIIENIDEAPSSLGGSGAIIITLKKY